MPGEETTDGELLTLERSVGGLELRDLRKIDYILHRGIESAKNFEELLKNVLKVIADIKIQQGENLEDQKIELELEFVINFLLLNNLILTPDHRRPEKIDNEEKEMSARIQHQLAHRTIYASSKNASDKDISETYQILSNTIGRINRINKKWSSSLNAVWSGTRNEIAAIRVLAENGFQVFLPDYTQDPLDIDEDDNQVLQLDIRNGIDLFAVGQNGQMYAMDIKGGSRLKNVNGFCIRNGFVVTRQEKNPCVRNTIAAVAESCGIPLPITVPRLMVSIPSEGGALMTSDLGYKFSSNVEEQRQQIGSFARLKPEISKKIVHDIANPIVMKYNQQGIFH